MKKLLVIGFVWPEPKTTAAGNRMIQLLEVFLTYNYNITFVCTASKTEHSHDLKAMGVREEGIKLNDSSFNDFVKNLNPEVVLFDRFMVEEQFGWRVAENCPSAIRVLNTEDLHSLREYRAKCVKKNSGFQIAEYLQQDKAKREIASIYRSDLTLTISSFEKKLLENQVGINETLLFNLPFMLPRIEDGAKADWPKFQNRRDFISYGNGYHRPNVDSFRQLKQTIWPLIKKELPEVRLHIYGAYLPQQVKEMHRPEEGFLVHGWVKNIEERVQQARVVLAPLRFGAGIKGKLITAMQCGTPSVTTQVGFEGISGGLPWPGMVCDTPTEFAKASIQLYLDKEEWNNLQDYGTAIINKVYDSVELQRKLMNRIEDLRNHLETHRSENIIGSLLQHQTMTATKFMGKWIEEKNKNIKRR